ncbi:hypothetical protein SUGI_1091780 [Cryptomeria japonica]|nr:hypothetical protein SUGI_1091780 [Cryptomeria japonica]
MVMDEIVEHSLGGPANSNMHACEDGDICYSDLVGHLAILEEFGESTCVETQPCHTEDSLVEYEGAPISEFVTYVMEAFHGDWHVCGGVELQLVYDPRDEHEGRRIPSLIRCSLPHTVLIDGCPTLLIMEFSGYILRTAAVWMDWDHYYDEILSSYDIGAPYISIVVLGTTIRGILMSVVSAGNKQAVEEGIAIGEGCVFLMPSSKVDAIRETLENDEQKIGVGIDKRALSYPVKSIAENAGVNGGVVVAKVPS